MTSSNSMRSPTFSVLVPVYNRPRLLKGCVDSILKNDYDDYEILLSDDCSPRGDEIAHTVEPYLKRYENIYFFRQPQNLGWTENRNFLVERARGKYVILMGDDDRLMPFTLSRIKYFISENPDNHIYTFGFTVIDEYDRYCYTTSSPAKLEINLDNPDLVQLLFFSNIVPFWVFHPFSMCYRRSVSEEIPYNKEAHIGDDLLFLIDSVSLGKRIFVIPESLFFWRKAQNSQHKYQNLSSERINSIIARRNILSILKERSNLPSFLFDLISTFQFRKTFLYDSIVLGGYAQEETLRDLQFGAESIQEILELASNCPLFFYHLNVRSQQIADFWRLFGGRGIFCLFCRLIEKLRYRFSRQLVHR